MTRHSAPTCAAVLTKMCPHPGDSPGYPSVFQECWRPPFMCHWLLGNSHTDIVRGTVPCTLSRCTTTTTTTTTSCSQVTCGFRCLRNATVHSPTSLPNCWHHHNEEACNDLVGYENGKGLFPCSLARPSLVCQANSATPC